MKIEVTQEDIANGIKNSCINCPVARALNRVGFRNANVGYNKGWEHYGLSMKFFRVPKELSSFIDKFDRGLPVEPASFEITWENYGQSRIPV